jgi:4-hydroxybutyryl-CoA dehydratase / vinylacetyl-CoA-Delta-isomerase
MWYRGKRVDDVLSEPDLRVAVDHSALDFELGHDPAYRDLAVATDPETGEEYSAYYRVPRSTDDLLARMKLIETSTALGGTLISLKDVGTDALFALQTVLRGVSR